MIPEPLALCFQHTSLDPEPHLVLIEHFASRINGEESIRVQVTLLLQICFDVLRLKRLFCQSNAFNVAPNRTLQRAGFKYIKTFRTVPGPLN